MFPTEIFEEISKNFILISDVVALRLTCKSLSRCPFMYQHCKIKDLSSCRDEFLYYNLISDDWPVQTSLSILKIIPINLCVKNATNINHPLNFIIKNLYVRSHNMDFFNLNIFKYLKVLVLENVKNISCIGEFIECFHAFNCTFTGNFMKYIKHDSYNKDFKEILITHDHLLDTINLDYVYKYYPKELLIRTGVNTSVINSNYYHYSDGVINWFKKRPLTYLDIDPSIFNIDTKTINDRYIKIKTPNSLILVDSDGEFDYNFEDDNFEDDFY